MDTNSKPTGGSLSKILVAALIIVVIAAAGVFVWMNFFNKSNSSGTDTASNTNSKSTSQESTAALNETGDTTGVNEEVNALDKSMAELDDDALSDSNISDSNLGL